MYEYQNLFIYSLIRLFFRGASFFFALGGIFFICPIPPFRGGLWLLVTSLGVGDDIVGEHKLRFIGGLAWHGIVRSRGRSGGRLKLLLIRDKVLRFEEVHKIK